MIPPTHGYLKYPRSRNYMFSETETHDFSADIPDAAIQEAKTTPQGMNSGVADNADMNKIMMCGTNQGHPGYNLFKNPSPEITTLNVKNPEELIQYMTATHMGIVSVGVCDVKDPAACLKQRLPVAGGGGFYEPSKSAGVDEVLPFTLPDIKCDHCILHWAYINRNSGSGPPFDNLETFTNCADVKLVGSENSDWSSLSNFWDTKAANHASLRGCYKPIMLPNGQVVNCDADIPVTVPDIKGGGGGGGGNPPSQDNPIPSGGGGNKDDDVDEETEKSSSTLKWTFGITGSVLVLVIPIIVVLMLIDPTLGIVASMALTFIGMLVGVGIFIHRRANKDNDDDDDLQ